MKDGRGYYKYRLTSRKIEGTLLGGDSISLGSLEEMPLHRNEHGGGDGRYKRPPNFIYNTEKRGRLPKHITG